MIPESELLTALQDWKRAMIAKDAATLDRVLHRELVYSHSNALEETKSDVLEKTGRDGGAQVIEFFNIVTKVFGDAGFVRADVDYTNRKDGVDSIAHLNVLHVFVKEDGRWQMVARQAVRRPEPTT